MVCKFWLEPVTLAAKRFLGEGTQSDPLDNRETLSEDSGGMA
jgi:hypothetical protein